MSKRSPSIKLLILVGILIILGTKQRQNILATNINSQNVAKCPDNVTRTYMSFSSDGDYVADGLSTGVVHLWQTQTGRLLHTFIQGKDVPVYSIAFSPDAKSLLTSGKSDVKLWSIDNATMLHTFQHDSPDNDGLNAIFLRNGKQILTSSGDGAILWDATSGKKIVDFRGNLGPVAQQMELSPDEMYLLTRVGEEQNTWQLWGLSNNRPLFLFQTAWDIGFVPDSKNILVESNDGLYLWNIQTQKKEFTFYKTKEERRWRFSPDSRYLAVQNSTNLELWDIQSLQKIKIFPLKLSDVVFSGFFANSKSLLIATHLLVDNRYEMQYTIWDIKSFNILSNYTLKQVDINQAIISPDGGYILISEVDNTLRLYNILTGEEIRQYC